MNPNRFQPRWYPAKRALTVMLTHGREGPFGRIPSTCVLITLHNSLNIITSESRCLLIHNNIKTYLNNGNTCIDEVDFLYCIKTSSNEKHFPRYWPFVLGIHRSPVNSLHKGQWHGALMFSLISAWIHGWINNRKAGDLRRNCDHYDVIVMNPPT